MGLIRPLAVKPKGRICAAKYTASKTVVAQTQDDYGMLFTVPFPLYIICCSEWATWKSVDYQPGRILVQTSDSGPDESPHNGTYLREDLDEFLCTQDVLLANMYEGTQHREGPHPLAPTLGYAHNLEVLREVAPQIRAIAVGNRMAEMGTCGGIPDGDPTYKEIATRKLCESIDMAAEMVGSVGGRLCLMLIDYHALIDCYWASGQPLRAKLQEHNVLTVFLLGFKFWPRCKTLWDHDPHERILPKELLDPPPYPMLQEWLRGLEAWSGVDYMPGLARGNQDRLFRGGFQAGVIGQLPDGSF